MPGIGTTRLFKAYSCNTRFFGCVPSTENQLCHISPKDTWSEEKFAGIYFVKAVFLEVVSHSKVQSGLNLKDE